MEITILVHDNDRLAAAQQKTVEDQASPFMQNSRHPGRGRKRSA
jgi:hypothetical protein